MTGSADVAIVDYGMGNLFSVRRACEVAGLKPVITQRRQEIEQCRGLILPGVGAFGDAMSALRQMDLVSYIRDYAASSRPIVGICLGIQLLMSESSEFGCHEGLGLIPGTVVRFSDIGFEGRRVKVPHIGWSRIMPPRDPVDASCWKGSLLDGVEAGEHLYFVHSFHVLPELPSVVLSTTTYGNITFCSTLRYRNITAFQYHPERSGEKGLRIYRNLADTFHEEIQA